MTSILEAREKGLQWISLSRFSRRYELRDDSGVVYAKLDFDKLIGRNAVAEGADHRWKIRTEGWLRPLVCMHELGPVNWMGHCK